jgi:hypothetical protein
MQKDSQHGMNVIMCDVSTSKKITKPTLLTMLSIGEKITIVDRKIDQPRIFF